MIACRPIASVFTAALCVLVKRCTDRASHAFATTLLCEDAVLIKGGIHLVNDGIPTNRVMADLRAMNNG